MKKTETKKPTVGTKKPFWDGRSRASTPGYREEETLEGLLNDGYELAPEELGENSSEKKYYW